jgi:hypothetical protein
MSSHFHLPYGVVTVEWENPEALGVCIPPTPLPDVSQVCSVKLMQILPAGSHYAGGMMKYGVPVKLSPKPGKSVAMEELRISK